NREQDRGSSYERETARGSAETLGVGAWGGAVDCAVRIGAYVLHEVSNRSGVSRPELRGAQSAARNETVAAFGVFARAFNSRVAGGCGAGEWDPGGRPAQSGGRTLT